MGKRLGPPASQGRASGSRGHSLPSGQRSQGSLEAASAHSNLNKTLPRPAGVVDLKVCAKYNKASDIVGKDVNGQVNEDGMCLVFGFNPQNFAAARMDPALSRKIRRSHNKNRRRRIKRGELPYYHGNPNHPHNREMKYVDLGKLASQGTNGPDGVDPGTGTDGTRKHSLEDQDVSMISDADMDEYC